MPLEIETPTLLSDEAAPSVLEPAPAPFLPLAATARTRRVRAAALTGWAVSLVLLAALGWGSVRWRGDVMRAWPPSERLYAALGLAPGQAAQ